MGCANCKCKMAHHHKPSKDKEGYLVGEYINNPMFDTVSPKIKKPRYERDLYGKIVKVSGR